MHATRHEIIACAFGRRLRQDRRLDLEKSALTQNAPRHLHQAMSENDVLLELRATQIQIAMAQAKLLRGQRLSSRSRYRDRRSGGRPHDFEALRADFDVPGRKLGVAHLCWARDDLALHEDDTLWT